jgi:hypothetical protein
MDLDDDRRNATFAVRFDDAGSGEVEGFEIEAGAFQLSRLRFRVTDADSHDVGIGRPRVGDVEFDIVEGHRFLEEHDRHIFVEANFAFVFDVTEDHQWTVQTIGRFRFAHGSARDDEVERDVVPVGVVFGDGTGFAFIGVEIIGTDVQVERHFRVSHVALRVDFHLEVEVYVRRFHVAFQFVRFRFAISDRHHRKTVLVEYLSDLHGHFIDVLGDDGNGGGFGIVHIDAVAVADDVLDDRFGQFGTVEG